MITLMELIKVARQPSAVTGYLREQGETRPFICSRRPTWPTRLAVTEFGGQLVSSSPILLNSKLHIMPEQVKPHSASTRTGGRATKRYATHESVNFWLHDCVPCVQTSRLPLALNLFFLSFQVMYSMMDPFGRTSADTRLPAYPALVWLASSDDPPDI